MRTALMVGISGYSGKALLNGLINNKHYKQVVVFTRRENKRLKNIHVKKVSVDFGKIENYVENFQGVDDVFCLLGQEYIRTDNMADADLFDYEYPLSFARAAKDSGIRNFYLLNPTKSDINSPNEKFAKRARLALEISRLGFDNFVVFKVNKVLGPSNTNTTFYAAKKGLGTLLNFVGMGLINKVKSTPSNLLAQKIIGTAISNFENKKEFLPEDY